MLNISTFCRPGPGWRWTGRFPIDKIEDVVIHMGDGVHHLNVRVEITMALDGVSLVVLRPDSERLPDAMKIMNHTSIRISVHQKRHPHHPRLLGPGEALGFAWDDYATEKDVQITPLSSEVRC